MYIGSGVVISSGAVLGIPSPAGNLVFSYNMGNSASFNGQGIDLTHNSFINAPPPNTNFIFDLSADYANGAIGNTGVYYNGYLGPNPGDTYPVGNNFVNHGSLSYLSFSGINSNGSPGTGQYVDSNYVNGYTIPSGSSYTYFAVVRVKNFGVPTNPSTWTGGIVGGNNTVFGFIPPGAAPFSNYPILFAGNQYNSFAAADIVTQFQPNTWYAVAVTYDSTSQTMKVYTNGVLASSMLNPTTGVLPFSGNEPVYWGTWEGDNWLNGDLAVMQAYTYALTQSEITTITNTYGNPYGITSQRQDNDMPTQTYSQLFSVPGEYTFTVPAGVTRISTVAVGAGGGGTWGAYSPPGGDSYVYQPWSSNNLSMLTNDAYNNAPFITFDCTSGVNPSILGNVAPGWLVVGNDLNNSYPNRALIEGNVYAVVTSIDTSNTSNVVIGLSLSNVTSISGGSYNFLGNVVVGAQGALEINSNQYYTNNNGTPGPRALPLVGDGGGKGGVVDSLNSWPIGGAGAGGYGTSANVVAFDPTQTYVYDGSGDGNTGVANVVLALSNNNLTVAGTANNTSGNEGIATGTYSFLGSQVMFSLTVDVHATFNAQGVGFGNYNANIANYIGGDTNSVGFYNSGYFYFDNNISYSGYPSFFGVNNIVDIAIDDINHLTWVRVNGGDWMGDPAANPSTGANGVPYTLTGPLYLMVTAGDANDLGQLSINASNTYPIPSGYTFIAGAANVGSNGGSGTTQEIPTNTEGLGNGSIGGSGGGGGGIYTDIGSGGGGVGVYGVGNPGTAGGWVSSDTYNANNPYSRWQAQAVGGRGGSRRGNSGTQGGIASAWAGGAGGWPGGGGGSGTSLWDGGNGGALAYKNNFSVTPNTPYSVIVGQGGWGGGISNATFYSAGVGAAGAVRIVWPGDARQFPDTDVGIESGPTTLTININDFNQTTSVTFTGGTIGSSYTQLTPANSTVAQNLFAFFRTIGAYTQNSLNYNGSPNNPNFFNSYIFNVTWSAGSPVTNGLVRMGYNASDGTLYMTSVDPSNADYQIANPASVDPGGTTLPGTFNFPATITLYSPTTESGGTYWC